MSDSVLVTVTREPLVESEHHGAYCVVQDGEVVRGRGDLDRPVFLRSAAKPFQAVTVVESGACDRFQFTKPELAMVVGSHDGSPMHAQTAAAMLDRMGADPKWLRCAGHRPLSREVYEEYVRTGYQPGCLEDNCSGKHAGMIAAAMALGADPATYAERDHLVQQRNLANMALFCGLPESEIVVGVDGCAVPTFGIPVRAAALAAARFGTPEDLDGAPVESVKRILDAVTSHPEMVAGEKRFDTLLMRAAKGRLFIKMGAEGVLVAGLVGGHRGYAVKILDGRERALYPFLAALLVDDGILTAEDVAEFYPAPVLTREGEPTGEIRVHL